MSSLFTPPKQVVKPTTAATAAIAVAATPRYFFLDASFIAVYKLQYKNCSVNNVRTIGKKHANRAFCLKYYCKDKNYMAKVTDERKKFYNFTLNIGCFTLKLLYKGNITAT